MSIPVKQQCYRVGHAGYVSEFGQYIDKFLVDHPEVIADQRKGWDIFWDHNVDLEELKKAADDSAPATGYYYS